MLAATQSKFLFSYFSPKELFELSYSVGFFHIMSVLVILLILRKLTNEKS